MASNLPVILVTCAAGSTGREVVKLLTATGKHRVRAGVRNIENAKKLFHGVLNLDIVKLDDTDATSSAAFAGVHGVYLIVAEVHPGDTCFPMWIKHAKEQKVQHVVYQSTLTASPEDPAENNRVAFQQEEGVRASGIHATFLRPTFFSQNIERFYLPYILGEGAVVGTNNGGKFTAVDVRDIAAVGAKVLIEGSPHYEQIYRLTGEVTSDPEIAQLISEVAGHTIPFTQKTEEQWSVELSSVGVSPPMVKAVIELERTKDGKSNLPVRPDLTTLLGHPAIPLSQYVKESAHLFANNEAK